MTSSKFLSLLLALCLPLAACACGAQRSGTDSLQVYRVLREAEQTDGELLRPETIYFDGAPALDQALSAVFAEPEDPALSNGMGGAHLLRWSLAGGEAALELSWEYGALAGMDRTVADYCLTLTLCQLRDVDAVSIYCSGAPTSLGLTAADVLLFDAHSDPYERQAQLYFSDGGSFLTEELRGLSVDGDMPAERYVVEELLRGPTDEGLRPLLPEGTRLLSVSTRDGLCTVNLSDAFLQGDYPDEQHRRLAVYSLVNTLTALSGVEAVAIWVDGVPVEAFGALDLSAPVARCGAVIGPVNTARGQMEAALCCLSPQTGVPVTAPRIVDTLEYTSAAEAVLAALTAPETETILDEPFAGVEVLGMSLSGGVCTVDLPGSFFQPLDRSALDAAVLVLVRSLTSLAEVDTVRLLRDGEPLILFGRNYSQPMKGDD